MILILGGSFSDCFIPSCENGFAAGGDLDEPEMLICGLGVSVGVGVGAFESAAVGSELEVSAEELAVPSFASRLLRIYESQLPDMQGRRQKEIPCPHLTLNLT